MDPKIGPRCSKIPMISGFFQSRLSCHHINKAKTPGTSASNVASQPDLPARGVAKIMVEVPIRKLPKSISSCQLVILSKRI